MKPTLADLRAAAEKAKAWRPYHHCELLGQKCELCKCAGCLGAKRAAEDVFKNVNSALEECCDEPKPKTWSVQMADRAARIESYFGPPGPVAALAAMVRDFVGGER